MHETPALPSNSSVVRRITQYVRNYIRTMLPPRFQSRLGASDLVQDAWMSILTRLPSMMRRADHAGIRRLLRSVARFKACEAKRANVRIRRSVLREVPDVVDQVADPGLSPSEAAIHEEMRKRLQGSISDVDREILEMHLQGATPQEIADKTQRSVPTVYRRINRQIRSVIQQFDERQHESPPRGSAAD